MLFFHILLTSATLTVSAVPFPVNSGAYPYGPSRPRGRPARADDLARPLQDPKVGFPKRGGVPAHDQDRSRAGVLEDFHIFSAENPAAAKMTKLAHVPGDWAYLENCQSLTFRYCEGMRPTTRTAKEGERTIYRSIPPAKPLVLSFNRDISVGQNRELTGLITKYYNALPPNSPYRRADVTRVEQGWAPGGGNTNEIKDHVKPTSHSSIKHSNANIIGEPHIIRRPLTVSFGGGVDPGSRDHIEKKIREKHASMGPTDTAEPFNVVRVEAGSYKNADGKNEVQAEYRQHPDCPKSQDQQYKSHGVHSVVFE